MKKIIFFLFLLFITYPIYTLQVEEDAYIEAIEFFNKSDFKKAKEKLESFLKEFPESKYKPNVLLKLGQLESDFRKAIEIYDDIIKNYSGTEYEIEAIYNSGILLSKKEKYEDAILKFQKILNSFSESIWTEPAFYNLLFCFYALKNYNEAEKIYEKYKQMNIYNAFNKRINLIYANILYDKKEFSKAVRILESIIENTSEEDKYIYFPYVYQKIIECYRQMNNKENTEKYEKEFKTKYPRAETLFKKEDEKSLQIKQLDKERENNKVIYTVQVGAYTNQKIAEYMYKKFLNKKYTTFLKKEDGLLKLQVGKFDNVDEAEQFAKDFIKKEKLKNYLIKEFKE